MHNRPLLSVQYLRAIAALMVIFHHARTPQPWLFNPAADFIGGAFGVDIFFVVSGFIMFTAARDEPVGTFLWRRLVRVAPLYWLATLALLCVLVVRGSTSLSPDLATHIVKSMLFIPHWNLETPGKVWPFLVAGWSLNYEMFFYGVFAIAIAFRRPVLLTSALLLLLVGIGGLLDARGPLLLTYTSTVLLQFLAGVWIGYSHARAPVRRLGLLLPLGFLVLLALDGNPITRGAAASAILLGALSLEARMSYIHVLKRLGDASYSIYLFHGLAVLFTAAAVKRLPVTGWPQFLLMVFGSVIASAVLGLLAHRYVERPLLLIFTRRRENKSAAVEDRPAVVHS